tara:strand:+ start:3331 stop:3441 length:111 start_codon:yes stop_codon:yes gene_type:complete
MLKQHFILRDFQIKDTRLPDAMAVGIVTYFVLFSFN